MTVADTTMSILYFIDVVVIMVIIRRYINTKHVNQYHLTEVRFYCQVNMSKNSRKNSNHISNNLTIHLVAKEFVNRTEK